MNFWKTSGYSYQDLVNVKLEKQILLINSMDRIAIIEWLAWNDPNGIYTDAASLKEFGNTMSRNEGIEILLRQLEENRVA